ncbi:MAG: PilW family protein [Longimicrobiales bacterium]
MRTDHRCRQGLSLAELVVALWLSALVAAIVVTLLHTVSRLAGHSADRADVLEATRTAAAILSADLAGLDPIADLYRLEPESLSLRVFRGTGIVCGFAGSDPLVRYRGLRQPEPVKDSVLVLTASPAERAVSLDDAAPAAGACPAAATEDVFRIRLATALVDRDLIAIFEPGSYHLDGAFRYRRGAGGRQPVTADVFADSSGYTLQRAAGQGGVVGITARLYPQASSSNIRGAATGAAARVRVPLRNREDP